MSNMTEDVTMSAVLLREDDPGEAGETIWSFHNNWLYLLFVGYQYMFGLGFFFPVLKSSES